MQSLELQCLCVAEMWNPSMFNHQRSAHCECVTPFAGHHSVPPAKEEVRKFAINALRMGLQVLNVSTSTSIFYTKYIANPTLLLVLEAWLQSETEKLLLDATILGIVCTFLNATVGTRHFEVALRSLCALCAFKPSAATRHTSATDRTTTPLFWCMLPILCSALARWELV